MTRRSVTRRRFLEGSLATTVGLASPRVLAGNAPPDLVEVSGKDPHTMVKAGLEAMGGMARFVARGDYVVLKPNAAFANPSSWGTTTDPATVVAVAKACLEAGAKKVTVIEFPQAKGQKCLDRCGLTDALKTLPEVKIKLLEGAADFKKVKVPGGVALQSVEVAKLVLSADALISIPAAKAHNETGVSFGIKNAMGLILDRQVFHTRLDLHQAIADLARVIKPKLTVLDATRALLSNGPAGPGETTTPGKLVLGANVVSVDAYGLGLARFNQRSLKPEEIRHIALAAQAGLGSIQLGGLRIEKVQV